MTEQQITDETTVQDTEETPLDAQEAPVEAPEAAEDTGDKKGNGEAAKWRVRLRETETERDALKARVGDMQAAEVARLATGPGALHDGQDLLLTTKIDDLLDDEGNLDPEKVSEAVATLVEKKPHLAKPAFESGVGIGEKSPASSVSWADVIAG